MKRRRWLCLLAFLLMSMNVLLVTNTVHAAERHYFVCNNERQGMDYVSWKTLFKDYTGENISAIESIEFIQGTVTSAEKASNTAEHFGVGSSNVDGRSYGIKADAQKYVIGSFDSYTGKLTFKSNEVIYAPENCTCLFDNLTSLTSITFNNFDMSEVKNLYGLFAGCGKLSNVTFGEGFHSGTPDSLNNIFGGAVNLSAYQMKNILTNIGTASVTDMGAMFNKCSQLTAKDIEKIFTNASGVPEQKQVTTRNANNMASMFIQCTGITSLDFLKLLDMTNVKSIGGMFYGCTGLKNITIPEGVASGNIEEMNKVFAECINLRRADVSNLDTSSATTFNGMFKGDIYIGAEVNSNTPGGIIGLEKWNTPNLTNLEEMFSGCCRLKSLDLSGFDTSKVTSTCNLFYLCSALSTIQTPPEGFNLQSAKNTRNMFSRCQALKSVAGFLFNSKGSNTSISMFYNCSSVADPVIDFTDFKLINDDDSMISGLTNDAIQTIGLPQSDNNEAEIYLPKLAEGYWYIQGENTPVEKISIYTGNHNGKKVYVTKTPMSKVNITGGTITETDKQGTEVSDGMRYAKGTRFTVKADIPEGRKFDSWAVESGDITIDTSKEVIQFTLESTDVVLKANFIEPEPEHTEHIWDDGKVTKEATCTKAGERTYTCTTCGETRGEEIKASGHKEVIDVKVEATCEKTGLTEGSHCEVCGEVLKAQEEIKALGHKWEDDFTVDEEASCEKAGKKSVHCFRCNQRKYETEIPASGHVWDDGKVTKEETCTKAGEKIYTCTTCGEIRVEEIKASGHKWEDDFTVDEEASCEKAGKKSVHCSRCNQRKYETEIPTSGHKEVIDAKVEATCEKTGLTEGSHCKVCGEVLKAQKVIPQLKHAWDHGKVTEKATCTKAGKRTYTCTICGEIRTEKIAQLKATITLPSMVNSVITMQVKQSVTNFKVTGLAEGDLVTSIKSSNTKVLNVSKVKLGKTATCALKAGAQKGTTYLTITLKSRLVKKIKVNVQTGTVKTSKLDNIPKTLQVMKGKIATITPVKVPFTSQEKVTYESVNKNIATVSSTGKVTGKKAGTTKITVKSGKKSYSIKVIVK